MIVAEFINLLQNIKEKDFEIYVYNELNQLVPPKIEFPNKKLNEKRGIKSNEQIIVIN